MRIERQPQALIVAPSGPRLDSLTSLAVKQAVAAELAGTGSHLVLDLGAVQFMDSSGLGALVSLLKMVAPSGRLLLCHVDSPRVLQLLQLTRMDRIMPQYPDLDAALAALE